MHTGLIKSEIKRTTNNLLIVSLILLIISIVILAYNWSEFNNIVLGPKEVKIGEISNLNINGFSARNYVRVSPEKKASTGLQYVEKEYDNNNKEISKTVESIYYVLKDGQNLIFAVIPPDKGTMSSYTGWVRDMTSEEKDHLYVYINDLKSTGGFTVSEYVLDAEKNSSAPFLYVVCGIIIIISIINILRCIKYINCPEKHKIYKKLMKYGNAHEAINSIEEELPYDLFQNNKNIYFLKSWILSPKLFSLGVNKIDDIVWAYKKVTKHSINFIPTGKTYNLVLCFYNKSKCFIGLKENQIDYILISIKQKYPWIIVGYDKNINSTWNSNFSQLINYVQAKKQRTVDN